MGRLQLLEALIQHVVASPAAVVDQLVRIAEHRRGLQLQRQELRVAGAGQALLQLTQRVHVEDTGRHGEGVLDAAVLEMGAGGRLALDDGDRIPEGGHECDAAGFLRLRGRRGDHRDGAGQAGRKKGTTRHARRQQGLHWIPP
ncbi:hypothetical protein ACQ859_23870 [Roseateles chitinivorans]|uniref:hypothetical protein n=1 Tax=Roseateles chitinivorans TaxID=2917965 RepID=UPI003D6665AC